MDLILQESIRSMLETVWKNLSWLVFWREPNTSPIWAKSCEIAETAFSQLFFQDPRTRSSEEISDHPLCTVHVGSVSAWFMKENLLLPFTYLNELTEHPQITRFSDFGYMYLLQSMDHHLQESFEY